MLRMSVCLATFLTFVFAQDRDCAKPTFKNTRVTLDFAETYGKPITGCVTPETLKKNDLNYDNIKIFQVRVRGQNIPVINEGAVANFPDKLGIYFNRNTINKVKSGAFLNLPKVTEISLQNDQISELEVGVFANLPSLETVHINYNKLRLLEPNTFDNLPQLEIANIDHNQFEYFEQEWFRNTPKLIVINIDHNSIRTLNRASFANIPSLEYLLMHSNQIVHIHKHAFSGLKNLTYLNLGYNKLKTLDVSFNSIPLTTFLLYANNLTYIPSETLEDIRYTITQFEIYGNPFQCACYDKIIQWSTDNKIEDPFKRCRKANIACVYPEKDDQACLEDVSDDLAQELDTLFHASYNDSCQDAP